jgi:hypothetical protein
MVPLFSSLIGDSFGVGSIGKLTGFLSSIHAIGASIGTYMLGAIYNSCSSYFWGFSLMVILSFIASISSYFMESLGLTKWKKYYISMA